MQGQKLSKKITIKDLVGDVRDILKEMKPGDEIPIARFVGQCARVKTGTTQYGEYAKLQGQFKGTALAGEFAGLEMVSGAAILPNIANDMIAGAVGEGIHSIDFAFDITLIEDRDIAIGYTYGCNTLLELGEDDPLTRLEAMIPPLAIEDKTKAKK